MSQELVVSALTGLLISVVIIKLASGPAFFNLTEEETTDTGMEPNSIQQTPRSKTTDESAAERIHSKDNNIIPLLESNKSDSTVNVTAEQHQSKLKDTSDTDIPLINENHAMKKLSSLQGFLGLSDEQMQQAIRDTNNQINKKDTASIDAADNIRRSVDCLVFLVALIFGFYVLNVYSHGDFGRMISGLLPTEVAALKLKDYFMNFR